jgi:hypothetical protein
MFFLLKANALINVKCIERFLRCKKTLTFFVFLSVRKALGKSAFFVFARNSYFNGVNGYRQEKSFNVS